MCFHGIRVNLPLGSEAPRGASLSTQKGSSLILRGTSPPRSGNVKTKTSGHGCVTLLRPAAMSAQQPPAPDASPPVTLAESHEYSKKRRSC